MLLWDERHMIVKVQVNPAHQSVTVLFTLSGQTELCSDNKNGTVQIIISDSPAFYLLIHRIHMNHTVLYVFKLTLDGMMNIFRNVMCLIQRNHSIR